MAFESRVFKLAKDTEHPEQYQDAFALDSEQGIAAVADGVSSAIYSRQWANILTEAVVAEMPDPEDQAAFAGWLDRRRLTWAQQIDTTGLAWFQKAKLPNGAFSTLLFIRLMETDQEQEGAFGALRLLGFAIGDSVLIHVRGGEVVRTFPIQQSAELEANPVVLGSVDLNRDQLMQFAKIDVQCYGDDLLVLCTDAIAEWALRLAESGNPPVWDNYWDMPQEQWESEVAELRQERQMRYDDATLMLLRVVTEEVEVAEPEPEPEEYPLAEEEVVEAEARFPIVEEEEHVVAELIDTRPKPQPAEQQPAEEDDDWKDKFKAAGEQAAEGLEMASGEMLRGLKKWKKKAAKLYRDKFGPGKK